MKKSFLKKVLFASAAVGVGAAVMYVTTETWVNMALDRNQPKLMKKAGGLIAGGKTDSKFKTAAEKAAKNLSEKEHQEVKIKSADGLELIGHFFECKDCERVIIAFHGWRSSWNRDFGLISEFWQKNKCSVLYVEQRGQNNSGGEYMGFGLTERFDCVEWVKWAKNYFSNVPPIYLAGVSMGAATVLMASDLKFSIKPKGIMADCAFTSPKAIWTHVARKNLHMIYRIRSIFADMICRKKIKMSSSETSTVEALKKSDIPILFIHGADDKFVPTEMTYENYKACEAPKHLLIVPGANHAMSYYADKERYEETEKRFWNDLEKGENK